MSNGRQSGPAAPSVAGLPEHCVLTNKGEYGLMALVYLSRLVEGRSTQAAGIAASNGIARAFSDTILLDVRKAGFVRSKKGSGGGFMLARPPAEIRIGAVVRTVDGPIAPIPRARRLDYQQCDNYRDVPSCQVRLLVRSVRDPIVLVLGCTTPADMRDRIVGLTEVDP